MGAAVAGSAAAVAVALVAGVGVPVDSKISGTVPPRDGPGKAPLSSSFPAEGARGPPVGARGHRGRG